jgi:hypothetical protein
MTLHPDEELQGALEGELRLLQPRSSAGRVDVDALMDHADPRPLSGHIVDLRFIPYTRFT